MKQPFLRRSRLVLVEFVEKYPTFVVFAGLTLPAKLAGTSVEPLFADPKANTDLGTQGANKAILEKLPTLWKAGGRGARLPGSRP
jgi:hypothetical protein